MSISDVSAVFHDLPGHLSAWSAALGPWIYVALFAVVFAETGLIVTPFLPGDSLLFALGALTTVTTEGGGQEAILSFKLLAGLLFVAALCGDLVNYNVGRWLGLRLFQNPHSKIFNPNHLQRTKEFYTKHGGKTVIIARFLPIIRTYAPFVAGLGRMPFTRFIGFSVMGAAFWISLFLSAGHFFGNQPKIKANFQYVIVAIIVISLLPAIIEIWRARRLRAQTAVGSRLNGR